MFSGGSNNDELVVWASVKELYLLLFKLVAFQLSEYCAIPARNPSSSGVDAAKVLLFFWNCKFRAFVLHSENDVNFVHRAQSSTKSPPRSIRKLLKRWKPSSSKFFTLSSKVKAQLCGFLYRPLILGLGNTWKCLGVVEIAAMLTSFLEHSMKACWCSIHFMN